MNVRDKLPIISLGRTILKILYWNSKYKNDKNFKKSKNILELEILQRILDRLGLLPKILVEGQYFQNHFGKYSSSTKIFKELKSSIFWA